MRDALPALGFRGRIGVNTGEVVTGTEERLATGDAVNVAACFEQAAAAGEVLIGEAAHALVRDAVVAEPVEPLELKGKAEPVPAFRLVAVLDTPERSHASRFVGRERELALITDAWQRAQTESCCELLTVVGDAGVGKSRLVAEALATIGGSGCAGSLSAVRGGDHLLAGSGDREAAGGAAVGSVRCCAHPLAARRVGSRDERGRDCVGVPQAARGAGPARMCVRRRAVGRGDLSRPARVDGSALDRSTAAAPVHGAAGVDRASLLLANPVAFGAARPGSSRRADRRCGERRSARADRAGGGRQPGAD